MPRFTDDEKSNWPLGIITVHNGLIIDPDTGLWTPRVPNASTVNYAFTIETDPALLAVAPENQKLLLGEGAASATIWLKPVDPETFEINLVDGINNIVNRNLGALLSDTFEHNGVINIINEVNKTSLFDSISSATDNKCIKAIPLQNIYFATDDNDNTPRLRFANFVNLSPMALNLRIRYDKDDTENMIVSYSYNNVINPTIAKKLTMGVSFNDALRLEFTIEKRDAATNNLIDTFKKYLPMRVLDFKPGRLPTETIEFPFYQVQLDQLKMPDDYNTGLQAYLSKFKFPPGNAGQQLRSREARDFTAKYFKENAGNIMGDPENTLSLQQLCNKFNSFTLNAESILKGDTDTTETCKSNPIICKRLSSLSATIQTIIDNIHHNGIDITVKERNKGDLTSNAQQCLLEGHYYRVTGITYSYDAWLNRIKFYWLSTDNTQYIHGIQFVFDGYKVNNSPLLFTDCYDDPILALPENYKAQYGFYNSSISKQILPGYSKVLSPGSILDESEHQPDGAGLNIGLAYKIQVGTGFIWAPAKVSDSDYYGPGYFIRQGEPPVPISGDGEDKKELLGNQTNKELYKSLIDLTYVGGRATEISKESKCLDAILTPPPPFKYNTFEKQNSLIVKKPRP